MNGLTTVSIRTGKASGMLHRACVLLIQRGYQIRGNRIENLGDDKRISIILEGGVQPIPDSIIDEIRQIKGCLSVARGESEAAGAIPSPAPDAAKELVEAVRELLLEVYGEATDKQLERIMRSTPPAEHPRLFLEQCRSAVGLALGDAVATEMFESLFDVLP